MLFCYSILPIFVILHYREATMSFSYSVFPYPLYCIKERQQCRSLTQFYRYPLCYIIERRQARCYLIYPYSLCYIIVKEQCNSVT